MNNLTQPEWYVVYTKPRWEKKVAELLEKKNFEHYCPLNKVKKQWHDRTKIVMEPLFASYVFVRATPQQHTYIKAIPGIVSFIHWLGKPATVPAEDIQAIKDFLAENGEVELHKIDVNLHDTVKIIRGPLVHQEGKVVQISNSSVKVELPSMGYALVAKVHKTYIKISEKASRTSMLSFSETDKRIRAN